MTPTLEEMRVAVREVALHPALGKRVALDIFDKVTNFRARTIHEIQPSEWRPIYKACQRELSKVRGEFMPPMKIRMMLHFATMIGPFTPEVQRRSEAYVTFVRELLRDDMIERPTNAQRERHEGWAYRATPRGQCYVKALEVMPLPVRTDPEWAMPTDTRNPREIDPAWGTVRAWLPR